MAIKKFYDVKRGDKLIHKAFLLIAASDAVDIGEGIWCVAIQQPAYCDNLESEPDYDIETHDSGELDRLRAQVAELQQEAENARNEEIKWRRGLQQEVCLNAPLRRQIRILVEAGERILEYGDIYSRIFVQPGEESPYEQLKAAIAAAERKEGE